jgi:hypothetical protein
MRLYTCHYHYLLMLFQRVLWNPSGHLGKIVGVGRQSIGLLSLDNGMSKTTVRSNRKYDAPLYLLKFDPA